MNYSNRLKQIQRQKNENEQIDFLSCKNYIVTNSNNEIIGGNNYYKKVEIASLTKMMTLWVTLQIIQIINKDPTQIYIKVSRKASQLKGTSAQLMQGDILNVEELLFGLMLPSGNDSAQTLAEGIGIIIYQLQPQLKQQNNNNSIMNEKVQQILDLGEEILIENEESIKYDAEYQFIQEMNRQSRILELKNTKYANAHGLSNSLNVSTALDQAKLSQIIMENERVRKIVQTHKYELEIIDHFQNSRKQIWYNTNQLLGQNIVGIKTGFTNTAGGCLATSLITQPQNYYFIVILGSKDAQSRFTDTLKLIKKFINQFQYIIKQ